MKKTHRLPISAQRRYRTGSRGFKYAMTTSRRLFEQGEKKGDGASSAFRDTGDFTYGGMVKITPVIPSFRFLKPTSTSILWQHEWQLDFWFLAASLTVARQLRSKPSFITYQIGNTVCVSTKGCTVWIAPTIKRPVRRIRSLQTAAANISEGFAKNESARLAFQDVPFSPGRMGVLLKRHGGLLWPIYWLLPYRRVEFGFLFWANWD